MLCNVVGASIVYKIVKMNNIALQCKSLIVLLIIIGDRVDRNGDTVKAESAHRRDCVAEVAETNIDYGVPHSPAGLQSKIVNKVLDKSVKV